MPEINPLTNNQIFLKKIAENTGSNYETGDVSEINPLTIDQIFLKEIAANTAGQSGDISELEGKVADNTSAIEAIVNEYGAKNLLPNNAQSTTDVNVTFTVNDDGSITTNGVPSSDFAKVAVVNNYLLTAGTYTLSDGVLDDVCPWLYLSMTNYTTSELITDTYNKPNGESTFTLESDTYISIVAAVYYSNPIDNVTIYPMIRDARITDPTYVPYAMTNRELTERVKVLTIPISSVTIDVASVHILHNNPCPTGYIPISAMFERGAVSNDSVLLTVYLDSGTDVRVIMYNCSSSSIELNGSVKVLCIKA